MQVKHIMTQNPVCCTPGTRLSEVARIMVEHDCGAVPVVESYDTGRPVGVVTDRDITCRAVAEGKNPLEMTAGEIMSQGCVTVTPTTPIAACCRLLEENQVRRVLVVDDGGACCGIVSQADVARHSKLKAAEVVRKVSQPATSPELAPEGGPGRAPTRAEGEPPGREEEPTGASTETAPVQAGAPEQPVGMQG